jgi:hypothetical protein
VEEHTCHNDLAPLAQSSPAPARRETFTFPPPTQLKTEEIPARVTPSIHIKDLETFSGNTATYSFSDFSTVVYGKLRINAHAFSDKFTKAFWLNTLLEGPPKNIIRLYLDQHHPDPFTAAMTTLQQIFGYKKPDYEKRAEKDNLRMEGTDTTALETMLTIYASLAYQLNIEKTSWVPEVR